MNENVSMSSEQDEVIKKANVDEGWKLDGRLLQIKIKTEDLFNDEEISDKLFKEQQRDELEKYLDRSLDECIVSRELIEKYIKAYTDQYYKLKDINGIIDAHTYIKESVNEAIDNIIKIADSFDISGEDLKDDLKSRLKLDEEKDVTAEYNTHANEMILDLSQLPLFFGETDEERLLKFLKYKQEFGVSIINSKQNVKEFNQDQQDTINNLTIEIEKLKESYSNAEDYINKLKSTVEKYSILTLHLKELHNEFKNEVIDEVHFINKITNLINKHK